MEIVSVGYGRSDLGAYCESEYTPLKIDSNNRISLISPMQTGSYYVYVQLTAHNGVVKNSLEVLEFDVESYDYRYEIELEPVSTVVNVANGGDFELKFASEIRFPGQVSPYSFF